MDKLFLDISHVQVKNLLEEFILDIGMTQEMFEHKDITWDEATMHYDHLKHLYAAKIVAKVMSV